MCGITGFLEPGGFEPERGVAAVRAMAARLIHRGPDDGGDWADGEAGIALGHRRLSIVDLSPAGRQPMASPGGRYVIVLNGEIYNHLELRRELGAGGAAWRGTSDTETLAAAVERWGLAATLRKSVGMFAIAAWDRRDRVLALARDRMGEKPLYYGWSGGVFLFGSELKALRAHPAFRDAIDRDVLPLYLRYGYVPAPYSIQRGIRKLPAGSFLELRADSGAGTEPRPEAYWSLREAAEAGMASPFAGGDDEAVAGLEARLVEAVSLQSIADVPLGAFLSGGVDSSAVVALMQSRSSRPVRTFTIGFREAKYDEAVHAREVARHLGTEHTEFYVTPRDAMDVIPRLPELYDEPFGDSSQIPAFLVSRAARRHVTVSLSGDGGDELFGGYERYRVTGRIWSRSRVLPRLPRRVAAGGLGLLPGAGLDRVLAPWLAGRNRPSPADRVKTMSMLLSAESEEQFYRAKISQWKDPAGLLGGAGEPLTMMADPDQWLRDGGPYERMMYADAMCYLPDDILVKVDRAAMGVGLETRVPMLDHRVVEFAWSLPLRMKVRQTQDKWLLRQVLYRHVPRGLIERPKAGFAVPVDEWIRGPLRDWAEDLLSEASLRSDGIFDPLPIRRKWKDHETGRYGSHGSLWPLLMFQSWMRSRSG